MRITTAGKAGAIRLGLLGVSLLLALPSHAASFLFGSGSQSNHLLILFAPGQSLQFELRHDGTIQTGEQLLAAVIQATGGGAITTPPRDFQGNFIPLADQKSGWNGQGLFAHFYEHSWGVFINGFAWDSFSASGDGSWTSYFTYEIGGLNADFTSAPIGARDRVLANGDHDAYVLTSTHPSPGLAAWKMAHGITDLQEDQDGDGMANLFEYALRRNPRLSDSAGAVGMDQGETNGIRFVSLSYRRPHDEWAPVPAWADASYDGVGYTVETSTDLLNWQSGTNHVTQIVTPDATGPMATVVARAPADSPRRFLRLRIHLP